MSNTINEKLTELASEFAAIRNDGKKNVLRHVKLRTLVI